MKLITEKPRIRKCYEGCWECYNDQIAVFGTSKEEAYRIFLSLLSNRHSAVAGRHVEISSRLFLHTKS